MPICQTRACGCSISSTSLSILGSGSIADPWRVEGASPVKETETARQARTGPNLFDGLYVHCTDSHILWRYSLTVGWHPVPGAGRVGVSLATTQFYTANSTVPILPWNTEEWDTHGYYPGTGQYVTIPASPAGLGGLYEIFVWIRATAAMSSPGYVALTKGISPGAWVALQQVPTGTGHASLGAIVDLVPGDVLWVNVNCATPGTANVDATFRMSRISD